MSPPQAILLYGCAIHSCKRWVVFGVEQPDLSLLQLVKVLKMVQAKPSGALCAYPILGIKEKYVQEGKKHKQNTHRQTQDFPQKTRLKPKRLSQTVAHRPTDHSESRRELASSLASGRESGASFLVPDWVTILVCFVPLGLQIKPKTETQILTGQKTTGHPYLPMGKTLHCLGQEISNKFPG